jgi:ABC-type molybdenum transport system ATPase subunit/photorepair protein PhrA
LSSIAERMAAAGTGNALELRGVSRLFGALAALTNISLTVRPGERRAVLGSNGAGKTTLLNCMTGDFPPTTGTVRFFGEDVTTLPPHERIRRGLRRTYQISLLFSRLTVRENVYLACRGVSRGRFSFIRTRAHDAIMQSTADLISLVHLEAVADRLLASSRTVSSASLKSRWRSRARRDLSCSTSRPPASRPASAAIWSPSSPRCRGISATSSLSTTWTWRCASSRA